MSTILSASTSSATTRSPVAEPIPGLSLELPASDVPASALGILNVPLFYVSGCGKGQDQGVIFALYQGEECVARGGYSFPFHPQHKGRLPMTLTAAVPLRPYPTELVATWEVYGAGVAAHLDSLSTLVAVTGTVDGGATESIAPALAAPVRERPDGRRMAEATLPFPRGASVRVCYRGPSGGALNIYSGEDIALHVNPRPNEGTVVLNSHLKGSWGPEERPRGFPLGEGEIRLAVWAGPAGFVIQASEEGMKSPFCHVYAYRLPRSRKLDRLTADFADLCAFSVQPNL